MRILLLAPVSAAAASLLLPGPTAADNPMLVGNVGPGFSISLHDPAGNAVNQIDPGTYTLVVHDKADIHNFDLSGPGVSAKTDIDFVGDQTFTVTFAEGRYTYVCDAHFATMNGKLTVGNPPPLPPPPTPKATPLSVHVGPGRVLAFPKGLAIGKYAITIHDLSKADNLHLKGPGVDRKTGIAFRGTVKWTVSLKAGTYRVWSDAHKTLGHAVKVD
ncbi:MAG: plastocyanin/azurin family copper-binding protein [Gaiellaceae bacterium]